MRLIDNNFAEEGLIVLADEQDNGRGRDGRVWESQIGNLFFSFLLQPNVSIDKIQFVGFLLAKNIISTILNISNNDINISYKWPNDILINDKKVAGILIQNYLNPGSKTNNMICGVGINISQNPKSCPSTNLCFETNKAFDKNDLLIPILQNFDVEYRESLKKDNMENIINFLKKHSKMLGKQIKVHSGNDIKVGICKDIDINGNLILENENRVEKIFSADLINVIK